MKATVDRLAEIGIFASLSRTELEQLQGHTAIRTYRQGEVVMCEGDRIPEKLYTLSIGSLRVAKIGAAGKETILRTLSGGDIFAAPALLGNAIININPPPTTRESGRVYEIIDRSAIMVGKTRPYSKICGLIYYCFVSQRIMKN